MQAAKSSSARRAASLLVLAPVALLAATGCPPEACECVDEDGDGFCINVCGGEPVDCDDEDAFVFPGAADHYLDGYDYDCSGGDLGGVGAPCSSDAHCTGVCNISSGRCAASPEDCRRPGDEDGDGQADCSDLECSAICLDLADALCAAPGTAGAAQSAPAERSAENACNGFDAGTAYVVDPGAPGQAGELTMWLAGGLGTLDVRTSACEEAGDCTSGTSASQPLRRFWAGGERLWVVVPGAATHTFYWSFEPIICGDGVVGASEQCDDGNELGDDGCSESCQLELDFDVCSVATPLNLGVTTVKTGDGTLVVETECGPSEGQPERAFALPVTSGEIRIAWTADAPVVISPRRPDCAYLPDVCEGPAQSGVIELDLDQRPASYLLVDGAANLQIVVETID